MLRTAPAPMRLLSRSVREAGLKVVLTGEGADEVLGGYDILKEAKVRQFWARQSRLALAAAAAAPPVSLSRPDQRTGRQLPARVLRQGPRRSARSLVLAPAALDHDRALQAVLERGFRRQHPGQRARAPAGPAAARDRALAPVQPRGVPRGPDPAARLPALLAGRPHADGELGGRPFPLPGPPPDRLCQCPAPERQDAGPEGETPAAPGDAGGPPGVDPGAPQAALPGPRCGSLPGRANAGLCERVDKPGGPETVWLLRSGQGGPADRKTASQQGPRDPGQHGIRGHPVHAAMAFRIHRTTSTDGSRT